MMRSAGYAGAVGIEVLLAIGVGFYGGQWLDGRWGTAPWLKWVGLVAGMGAAIKALARVTKQYKKMLEQDDRDASRSDKPDQSHPS